MGLGKSVFGSIATFLLYINWRETFDWVFLAVGIASGMATLGYTIYKWRRSVKEDRKHNKQGS